MSSRVLLLFTAALMVHGPLKKVPAGIFHRVPSDRSNQSVS
jgi:hypothetical protein